MAAPKCPTPLQLNTQKELIREMTRQTPLGEEQRLLDDIWNSLEYLNTMLNNRRGYQQKMQLRRKVLNKYAKEQGWDDEINAAVERQFPDIMNAQSLDDTEDNG